MGKNCVRLLCFSFYSFGNLILMKREWPVGLCNEGSAVLFLPLNGFEPVLCYGPE